MKINKGKIKNISKKLTCGAICFTLVTTGLSACGENKNFKYGTTKTGEYLVTGNISYENLSADEFVVIDNKSYDKKEYYICCRKSYINNGKTSMNKHDVYYNKLNNKIIFDTAEQQNTRKLIKVVKLEDFLLAYNNVKSYYSKEEVEEILELLKQEYEKTNEKELVKVK